MSASFTSPRRNAFIRSLGHRAVKRLSEMRLAGAAIASAKLKALLRAEAARTVEALWAAVGRLIARFAPGECARYLAHCGYGRSV